MSIEKVREYFDQFGMKDRVLEFDRSSETVELAAQTIGCEPKQITKTMSFLVGDEPILICMAGDARIANAKYKKQFGMKAKMISFDDVEDLTYYFTVSEQTPSAVSLGVLTRADEVEEAGGFIVQMMPDASEETISTIERNLTGIQSITQMLSQCLTPEDMMNIVLKDLEPSILDKIEVGFECDCSKDRVAEVFAAIGKKELKSIIDEDRGAEVGCQFCESKYSFSEDELKEIYDNM